jgi:hypothetical protein
MVAVQISGYLIISQMLAYQEGNLDSILQFQLVTD